MASEEPTRLDVADMSAPTCRHVTRHVDVSVVLGGKTPHTTPTLPAKSAPQPSASLDSTSNQLSAGPSGPNVLGLTVAGHGIVGSLVGRAMVAGAIEPNVGLALLAVTF
jgi:hypothetical protein